MEIKSLTINVDLTYMVEDARLTEARNIIRKLVHWGVIGEDDKIKISALNIEKIEHGRSISLVTKEFSAIEFADKRLKPGEKDEFV